MIRKKTAAMARAFWGSAPLHRMQPMHSRGIALFVLALALLPVAWGQHLAEINLFFSGAKPNLMRKEIARLDSLFGTIDLARIHGITLVGHTDSLFGRASNASLSEKRALSVKELIIERGVPGAVITAAAFNALAPIEENLVPLGRTRNRRVYMRIEYGSAAGPIPVPPE